jgi:hypothetical protein
MVDDVPATAPPASLVDTTGARMRVPERNLGTLAAMLPFSGARDVRRREQSGEDESSHASRLHDESDM